MKTRIKKGINNAIFIWHFAIDDFKRKYAGSVLGVLWAFLQPMITIALYWFVFQLGFKSQPIDDFPFILWLMVGLVPWFFISESIVNATTSMADYSYLVKKVVFKIDYLPLAKMLSVFFVQIALIALAIICITAAGFKPSFCYLQLFIYIVYMFLFATAVSYLTATLFVFFKDVIQIVSIVIQVVFWMTPIVYMIDNMPEGIRGVLTFNPIYYVISGFRNALVYRQWGGYGIGMTIYYWGILAVLLFVGIAIFKKCKDHFADVL